MMTEFRAKYKNYVCVISWLATKKYFTFWAKAEN